MIITDNEVFPPAPTIAYPFNNAPSLPNSYNIYDFNATITAYDSEWSTGATAISFVGNPLTVGQGYRLTGWSIGYIGSIKTFFNNVHRPAYGKLGNFYAGIVKGGVQIQYSAGPSGAGNGLLNFPPSDTSLIAKVWDGENDPVFPNDALGSLNLPNHLQTFQFQLPVPLEIPDATQLSFGIWLTPMLTTFTGIIISNLVYQLQYERVEKRV